MLVKRCLLVYNCVITHLSFPCFVSLNLHVFRVNKVHTPPAWSRQPCPFQVQSGHVRGHVDPSPVCLCPILTLLGDLLGQVVSSTDSVGITVEESESVEQVGVIDSNGNVVNPRLDTAGPPFRVDARFKDQRTTHQQPLSTRGPRVAVDVEDVFVLERLLESHQGSLEVVFIGEISAGTISNITFYDRGRPVSNRGIAYSVKRRYLRIG
jgi:hypothetical protein